MKLFLSILIVLFVTIHINAGPHTIQKGETFADVAELYNIPLDSILKSNPDTEAHVGLTIEIPLTTLVYDLGNSDLFRNLRYRNEAKIKKGAKLFGAAHKKQMKLSKYSGTRKSGIEEQIISDYKSAVSYGNTDALYQLGRFKVHGCFYHHDRLPTFDMSVNEDLKEFTEGIEYLQIAALVGNNDKALIELALACGYEKSPIRNPYLCLSMLEIYEREKGVNVKDLICYMYENGYGITQNLLQAYINCSETELTDKRGETHRERIMRKIEAMPVGFDSSIYGVGLDSKTLMTIAFSKSHNGILDPEGIFWLHRAARLDDPDANWALAGILQNDKYNAGSIGESWNKEEQILGFVKKAAVGGKKEAKDYLDSYEKQKKALAERERLRALERQRQDEEKKQRRRETWAKVIGTVVQTAAQTYAAVQASKMQAHQNRINSSYSTPAIPNMQMSDAQWSAKQELAMKQIMQYTLNKYYADWTGTPMVPTDMSAVDLGTDMSPGSPLWNWNMQQQINTVSTYNERLKCENLAFYRRQSDAIRQHLLTNPLEPIPGYVDRDGNWISYEMVAAENGMAANDSGVAVTSNYNAGSAAKTSNSDRYGETECYLCRGSGTCQTCGGKGYDNNSFGVGGSHECPNCYLENGRRTGLCSACGGKGRRFGLK